MHHFKTISEYCQFIQIAPPDYSHFDIRSFEENMPLVVKRTPPFRHEFFAIAIKVDGEGKAVSGFHKDFPKGPVIFFNTPYQILSWDIEPNWKGYYFMFTQDFIAQAGHFHRLLEKFPFLRMDQSIPLEIDPSGVKEIMQVYHHIYNEYYGLKPDKFQLIEVHVLLILNLVKRYFSKHIHRASSKQRKTADLHLITRYQTLIQTSFFHGTTAESTANIHSTSYYAEKLNVILELQHYHSSITTCCNWPNHTLFKPD
jgi:hypothetical protein